MKTQLSLLVAITAALTVSSAPAWAQDAEPTSAPTAEAPAPNEQAEAPAAQEPEAEEPATPAGESGAAAEDGPRYRWGIAASGGLEKVSIVSGPMAGMDLRLGAQLNDLLGVYVQSHLSFGKLSADAGSAVISGFTGTLTTALLGEVTLMDRFFAGAGVGYGILNNPSGPMLQARIGGYPLSGRIENSIRRRGLMVGLDVRSIFIDGATGVLILGSIGYEKF